jgi:fucose permease
MMVIGIIIPTITGYIADLIGIRSTFLVLILPVLIALVLLKRYVAPIDVPRD